MTHHHIKLDIEGPVASLVFNRPYVLNAFYNEAMDECVAALKELGDDQRVRAILVRGEGRARHEEPAAKCQEKSGLYKSGPGPIRDWRRGTHRNS
jgi:1,4-dihydroxy-2-naphthoyl-CoA synthase